MMSKAVVVYINLTQLKIMTTLTIINQIRYPHLVSIFAVLKPIKTGIYQQDRGSPAPIVSG